MPDISPTRGEIGSFTAPLFPAMLVIGESRSAIEMPGRAEGGAVPPAFNIC
ncbi:diaminohydroxyphosphoribosylaminopyrimidine deaminase [Mesorhizobium sp. B2-6-2]|nr:diaminohydroxyphosphoribosylaminopyrimidine deaminase [Mesorhizobium sp. B2-6-2]